MARPLLLALAIAQAVASNTTTSCACDVGSLVLTGPNGNSTVYIKDATPIGGQGDTYSGLAGPVGVFGGVTTGLLYTRTVAGNTNRWAVDYMAALNPMFDKTDDGACPEGLYSGSTGNITVACPPSPPPPSPSNPPPSPSSPPSPTPPPPAYICTQSGYCMGGLLGSVLVPLLLVVLWASGAFGSKCPRSPFVAQPQREAEQGELEITGGAGRVVVEMPAVASKKNKAKEDKYRSSMGALGVWGH